MEKALVVGGRLDGQRHEVTGKYIQIPMARIISLAPFEVEHLPPERWKLTHTDDGEPQYVFEEPS